MLGFGLYAAMVAGSALFHFYLWVRLVRDTTRAGTRSRRVGTGAVICSAVLAPATRILLPFLGPDDGAWLAWPGYLLIAVLLYLLTGLVLAELPRAWAASRIRRAERAAGGAGVPEPLPTEAVPAAAGAGPAVAAPPAAPPAAAPAAPEPPVRHIDRRLFLGRTVGAVVGTAALGTVGYGVSSALGDPLVKRVPIRLAKLDPRAAGLRIAVVSDLHLGPMLGRAHTERVVRMVNGLEPDLVAIVGDLADGTSAQLGPAVTPFRSLESRYGSFFVTGNHEYFYDDVSGWVDEVRGLGVRPLLNERVEIVHNGVAVDLAGVEDVTGEEHGRGPDFDRALAGRDASRPVVLLAHQPVLADEASRHGVDLQLSGHTHGGQMAPLSAVAALSNPVLAGLGTVGDTQLYVTRGTGFFGPPVRVGAPPDISLLELHPPKTT
ncbi:metallophosphoesterase [Streptomyces sp. VRA16 Mangrove soil]|uniref:metallophosphoesterase n=1 Tax=Streptomyces sp. VRA16 Mangrove soil TaxID=2817434 RepID=UPI001A9F6B0A|nr:metallophosphoesterase [Streptomyces sp. VRA16 Mangrove soil]MBO1334265.1 metallophosphoesterase [Streptomyces sp. VRA16 Mangrove soil]